MLFSPEQLITDLSDKLGISTSVITILLLVLTLWTLFWKGMALWKSSQRNEKWWFIALLLINTIGILEILYLYVFSKEKNASVPSS